MKRIICCLLAVMLINQANAQSSLADSLKKHYQKTYSQALLYNDINVAINSLQNILAASNGANNLVVKDTLAMLYHASKSYYSALILSKEVYEADPKNMNALARVASAYQNLGDTKNAVANYEIVAPALKDPYHYYQLAVCQYGLKRYAECESSIGKVLADTNSNKIAVSFVLPNGTEQQVPASAAALNMAAIMKVDMKDYASAKTYLEQALKLYPDFEGAQQNLNFCNENLKGTKPKPSTGNKSKPKS